MMGSFTCCCDSADSCCAGEPDYRGKTQQGPGKGDYRSCQQPYYSGKQIRYWRGEGHGGWTPDILANTGEWLYPILSGVQNIQSIAWDLDEVNRTLKKIMNKAYDESGCHVPGITR